MNKTKNTVLLILITSFLVGIPVFAQNVHSVKIETEYAVVNSVDNGSRFLEGWSEQTPVLMTCVDPYGNVSIGSPDIAEKKLYIYEYTQDLEDIRTIVLQYSFEKYGAFTKDNEGNYYIFSASAVTARNVENMAIEKYNAEGEKIKEYRLISLAPNSFNGVKVPFYCGSCRLEISANMLAVYFARQKFNGHQSSYGFVLDKDSFERMDRGQVQNNSYVITGNNTIPYVSHSFNQFILPVDNGFVFADQGDAYPRCFSFSKFIHGKATAKINTFPFKKGRTYQYTFSQMGGLAAAPPAETETGYIFSGTAEKNNITSHHNHNDSRNLFIININGDMSAYSKQIWITNYTNKNTDNAANPKIADLGSGQYLLMWEVMTNSSYKSTYYKIINQNGEALCEETELSSVRLNFNDVLRINPVNKKVYWAINEGANSIRVYSLNTAD